MTTQFTQTSTLMLPSAASCPPPPQAHLLEVYKVLRLWGAMEVVAVTGLLHSAYSNSYVNLAVFQPGVERSRVAALVGGAAEELIHLFCVVRAYVCVCVCGRGVWGMKRWPALCCSVW